MSHDPHKRNDYSNKSSRSKSQGEAPSSEPLWRAAVIHAQPQPGLAFDESTLATGGKAAAFGNQFITGEKGLRQEQKIIVKRPQVFPDDWENPILTRVGLYYPLGPCLVRVGKELLDQVLKKLRGVFRTLSLHTKYHDTPISAECVTLDNVEFQVIIMEARDSPDLVVEVCRRDGDSYSFHLYAQQILSAIKDGTQITPVVRHSWNMEELRQLDRFAENKVNNVEEALEIAMAMFSTERYDAQKLSFESLSYMTDPSKSGMSAAMAVTQCLMRPQNPNQERLSRLILRFASMETRGSAEIDHSMFDRDFERDAEDDLAYLGLVTASHVLQVAAMSTLQGDIQSFVEANPALLDGIVDRLDNVHNCPHHAYHAVKCLTAICKSVPAGKSRVRKESVEAARMVGENCHYALESVCGRLLDSLQA